MAERNVERRLAAILMADVVGYSRLMGENDTKTLQSLQEHQFALINPTIGQYHGRVIKLMGDGMLVEYQSVADAVECAVAIQHGMRLRNLDIAEDLQIRFRMGINVGDVIVEGDDIYGDGINVASRLQEIAQPDGICISAMVYAQIDGTVEHKFTDGGAHQFKNIANPVRVYHHSTNIPSEKAKVAFRPFIDMPGEEQSTTKGGCLCGNVRYEITGETLGSMLCHCRMCQRFSGAPILQGTTFPYEAFHLTRGEPKYYQSSSIAERGFCADCGAPMIYRGLIGNWTKWIVITTGSLDEPWKFLPTYHLGIESSLPWLNILDDLPRTSCKDSPSLIDAYSSVGLKVP